MFRSLVIENFQSHKLTEIQFDDGMNVITGNSDCGKTAILRALDWVCNNTPKGDDFRSTWGGDTRVTLTLQDGTEITREKSGKTGKNKYTMKVGKKTDTFVAFRTEVPPEIAQVISMNSINWQRQLDSPFLLSESPGKVASKLNKIVNLDVIDTGLTKIAGMVRENSMEIKASGLILVDTRKELNQFRSLPKMKRDLERLEELDQRVEDLDKECQSLESLVKSAKDQLEVVNRIGDVIELEKHHDKIESIVKRIAVKRIEHERLNRAATRAHTSGSTLKRLNTLEETAEGLEGVLELWENLKTARAAKDKLAVLVTKSKKFKSVWKRLDQEFTNGKNKLDSMMMGLEACPTCGKEMN